MSENLQARKFQITLNRPLEKGWNHEAIKKALMSLASFVYCCMADEIGAKGTPHTHAFVIFENPKSFKTIQRALNGVAHIEVCRGSNTQNREYIMKGGKWLDSDKKDTVLEGTFEEVGELPEDRRIESITPRKEAEIFDLIESLLDEGNSPKAILARGAFMHKYRHVIRSAYYAKRLAETPPYRNVNVVFHTGPSGSGKSHEYVKLVEEFGADNVYLLTDYANGATGGFDGYNGEPILFMEEFKGNIPFSLFLQLLDGYPVDIHSRYSNCRALWNTVIIASIYGIEELYRNMVAEGDRARDNLAQVLRRINTYVYHFKTADGSFHQYSMPASEYENYYNLRARALASVIDVEETIKVFGDVKEVK